MTYWYVLVLTYSMFEESPYDKWMSSYIWFPNYQTCADAMDVMYDVIYVQYPNSIARCIETDAISGGNTPPMLRPKNLTK
jgi:hypothetical protein